MKLRVAKKVFRENGTSYSTIQQITALKRILKRKNIRLMGQIHFQENIPGGRIEGLLEILSESRQLKRGYCFTTSFDFKKTGKI